MHRRRGVGRYDVVVLFCPHSRRLHDRFVALIAAIGPAGAIWVCWPKRASGIATDLREQDVREYELAGGLVDVKVAAIDDVWAGLKFVRRLADR